MEKMLTLLRLYFFELKFILKTILRAKELNVVQIKNERKVCNAKVKMTMDTSRNFIK